MKEQELDRLLEKSSMEETQQTQQEDFRKKLHRAMNKTLFSRIFAALLATVLLGAALYFGTSAAMNAIWYDPGDEALFLDGEQRGTGEFRMLLEDTIDMYFPGRWCMVVGGMESFRPTGFAGYDVDVQLDSPFDRIQPGGPPTHTFHIRRSRLDTNGAPLSIAVNEFLQPGDPGHPEYTGLDQLHQELDQLPDSAQLEVSLSFSQYMTADQVAQLMRDYPQIVFQWLALRGHAQGYYVGAAGGMAVYSAARNTFAPELQDRYAGYYLPPQGELTGADLEQCLRARLQLLADHPDFLRMMGSQFAHIISPEAVEARLALAQKEWACYGIRLMAGRQDLARMLEQLPVSMAWIQDVKVSRFQRP